MPEENYQYDNLFTNTVIVYKYYLYKIKVIYIINYAIEKKKLIILSQCNKVTSQELDR